MINKNEAQQFIKELQCKNNTITPNTLKSEAIISTQEIIQLCKKIKATVSNDNIHSDVTELLILNIELTNVKEKIRAIIHEYCQ